LRKYQVVLFGYLGIEAFASETPHLIDMINEANTQLIPSKTMICEEKTTPEKNILFICDPVLGESGRLYMPQSFLSLYREKLIPKSFLITPNQTEAEVLSGVQLTTLDDIKLAVSKLHDLGVPNVIITSFELPTPLDNALFQSDATLPHDLHLGADIQADEKSLQESSEEAKKLAASLLDLNTPVMYSVCSTRRSLVPPAFSSLIPSGCVEKSGNIDRNDNTMFICRIPKYASYVSGTGDLLASLITAKLCYNMDIRTSWELGMASIHCVLRRTLLLGRNELAIVQNSHQLLQPGAKITSFAI